MNIARSPRFFLLLFRYRSTSLPIGTRSQVSVATLIFLPWNPRRFSSPREISIHRELILNDRSISREDDATESDNRLALDIVVKSMPFHRAYVACSKMRS